MRTTVLTLLALVFFPGPTSALTIDEVVALSKAGVNEEVVLALIERDNSIFTMEPQQLITLRDQGVSERLVLAMLKSGRQELQALADPRTLSAVEAAPAMPSEPLVAFVGKGPDRPNTYHSSRDHDAVLVYTLPYVPYAIVDPCVPVRVASRGRGTGRVDGSRGAVTSAQSVREASGKFVNNAWPQVLESVGASDSACDPAQAPRGRHRR